VNGKVVAIVQARCGSSRLPGKSLRAMCGKPMVRHVLDRVSAMGFELWMATSVSQGDDLLAAMATDWGFNVYRGSEWDVLGRIAGAAKYAEAETVIRVTADCPLWAPDVGMAVFEQYMLSTNSDVIVTNDTSMSGWPDGLDTEVFSESLLALAAKVATDRNDREHVTPWLRRNAPHIVVGCHERWQTKVSVDTIDDFERAHAIMARIGDGSYQWKATRAALLGQSQPRTVSTSTTGEIWQ
jgi:spore coat polysaccharide biosynthesis protein SpsF